jgi:molecular chaperone DnaK (HSP70)
MSSSNKKRYTGEDRKLVVAIDIGTTFSAVSLSILQPGEVPQFEQVRHLAPCSSPTLIVQQILEWPKQVRV